jgi:hypothetical protein
LTKSSVAVCGSEVEICWFFAMMFFLGSIRPLILQRDGQIVITFFLRSVRPLMFPSVDCTLCFAALCFPFFCLM